MNYKEIINVLSLNINKSKNDKSKNRNCAEMNYAAIN